MYPDPPPKKKGGSVKCGTPWATVDCRSLATSKLNSGKPRLLEQRERSSNSYVPGKSIVIFHCSACLLQDVCSLL